MNRQIASYLAPNILRFKVSRIIMKMKERLIRMKNPEVTYVPISALNRGNAIHVIEEVKEKDCAAFILKNNVPEAVIISAERFRDYQDYLFYRTVAERVEYSLKHPEEKRISLEEVLKKAGIGKEDLERIGDVEFEYR